MLKNCSKPRKRPILTQSETPKKQHYVPRYYLRRFTDEGERLWVDDLVRGKRYKSNVGDVCEENYLYEMLAKPTAWHGSIILPGRIERRLSEIEGDQAKLLTRVDRQAESGRITEKDRRGVAWVIAHFIARHPAMLAEYEPDYDAMMSDPLVREGCELLEEHGMGSDIEVLANGANLMVLTLWRRKGSPTYFAKANLESLNYRFLKTSGDARFITSSLPPHFNTSERADGKEHIDDLLMPLSSTLAVEYGKSFASTSKPVEVSDEEVVRMNAGYYLGVPLREKVLAGRESDLSTARDYAQRWKASNLIRFAH